MTTKTETKAPFIRRTFGVTGAFSEIFNAIGAGAHAINNLASIAAEGTEPLPELAHRSATALAVRANRNLDEQLALLESNS